MEAKPKKLKRAVLYSYATDVTGEVRNINDLDGAPPYECPNCRQPMIAKRGSVRTHHYAHKAEVADCVPDDVLHVVAQRLIIQSFRKALQRGSEYRLGVRCASYGCEDSLSKNIAKVGMEIAMERQVVEDTRSDLVLTAYSDVLTIIEIVVTHDLEPETLSRYRDSDIPVLTIRPTWETLHQLETEIISCESINLGDKRCSKCKYEESERRRKEEIARRQVDLMLKRMDQIGPPKPFRHWTEDKYGRPIYPHVRRKVFANAEMLTSIGFTQANRKAHLFLYTLPKGAVFADFGSTEEVPIWEDTSALIYLSKDALPTGCGTCDDCNYGHTECCRPCSEQESVKRHLIQGVLDRCGVAGAEVRVSFYDRHLEDCHV